MQQPAELLENDEFLLLKNHIDNISVEVISTKYVMCCSVSLDTKGNDERHPLNFEQIAEATFSDYTKPPEIVHKPLRLTLNILSTKEGKTMTPTKLPTSQNTIIDEMRIYCKEPKVKTKHTDFIFETNLETSNTTTESFLRKRRMPFSQLSVETDQSVYLRNLKRKMTD